MTAFQKQHCFLKKVPYSKKQGAKQDNSITANWSKLK
jgi:hypothetical protein